MIHFYKTINGKLTALEQAEAGCWVSVYEPTQDEIAMLTEKFGLDVGFVRERTGRCSFI